MELIPSAPPLIMNQPGVVNDETRSARMIGTTRPISIQIEHENHRQAVPIGNYHSLVNPLETNSEQQQTMAGGESQNSNMRTNEMSSTLSPTEPNTILPASMTSINSAIEMPARLFRQTSAGQLVRPASDPALSQRRRTFSSSESYSSRHVRLSHYRNTISQELHIPSSHRTIGDRSAAASQSAIVDNLEPTVIYGTSPSRVTQETSDLISPHTANSSTEGSGENSPDSGFPEENVVFLLVKASVSLTIARRRRNCADP